MKIGFIGIGLMGGPLARNLIRAGKEVYIYGRNQQHINKVLSAGTTGKVVKKYLDEGNTTSWIFNAFPAGFGDVFGNGVQAYVSGEKTWDEVVSDCKDAWSKARSK